MQLINRKNSQLIWCVCYTVISLAGALLEIVTQKTVTPSQVNLLLIASLSGLAVGLLALYDWLSERFEQISPLGLFIIQYLLAVAVISLGMWLASFWVELHPKGYSQVLVSFSVPYGIGVVIYGTALKKATLKANQQLKELQHKR
ncbi:DUF6608 family protein [Vagococcus humatus]|uniref:DUF3021 domain-containing protein n=1 Tax=Vagococcus humatus TaxID=1889241 RepID=A0A3S0GEN2_9ENTE|nr:DUF6608 family protein [Vagococcus humatus]RST90012.1 hypothetical protein C7P63_02730 [Vagococcus humatus]